MSTDNTIPGPITQALEARRAAQANGIEGLRALRERNAAARAERDRLQAIEDAEQAEAEAAFAQAEAEARRQEALAEARERFANAQAAYKPFATTADKLVNDLNHAIAATSELCGNAIMAERERDQAGKALIAAHQHLANLDEHAPSNNVVPLRLHTPDRETALGLTILATTLIDGRFTDQRDEVIRMLNPKAPIPQVHFARR